MTSMRPSRTFAQLVRRCLRALRTALLSSWVYPFVYNIWSPDETEWNRCSRGDDESLVSFNSSTCRTFWKTVIQLSSPLSPCNRELWRNLTKLPLTLEKTATPQTLRLSLVSLPNSSTSLRWARKIQVLIRLISACVVPSQPYNSE